MLLSITSSHCKSKRCIPDPCADTPRADLARDAVSEEGAGRTHALLPLDIASEDFEDDLGILTTIDLERHELHKITALPLGPSTDPSRVTQDRVADIYAMFARSDLSPVGDIQERYQRDVRRLVLDLTLSSMVVHSEKIDTTSASSVRESQEPETADNLFERTGQLTLNDTSERQTSPPLLKWLAPRADFDAQQDAQPPDVKALDTPASRLLLNEWSIGADPTQFTWKDWRRETSVVPTPVRRPVRPLPSPRGSTSQTFAQSQPNPRYQLPTVAQPRSQWALHGSNSIPNIVAHGQGTRSSPPPIPHSSQSFPDLGASTQAERGPFGGRPDSKVRKKLVKKRVGGF